jgi:hypothetical protein
MHNKKINIFIDNPLYSSYKLFDEGDTQYFVDKHYSIL